MKPDPEAYARGIDTLEGDALTPELKCREPCRACADNDPSYCTACWGPGPSGENKLTFLQAADGMSTCKTQCDVKSTVNGWAVEPKGADGKADASKTYQVCSDCDVTCHTCEGQASRGEPGDAAKCLTCDPSFKYFLPAAQACAPTCPGGYYRQVDKPWGPLASDQSSCDECEAVCTSCRACNPLADPNCDAKDPRAGAKYCTACDQSKFSPIIVDDLDTAEQYFLMQAGMAAGQTVILTQPQRTYIATNFNRTVLKMGDFLTKKVQALPDGSELPQPLTETGLVVPTENDKVEITQSSTYSDLYEAMYSKYDFPPQSLLQGRCRAFCPDGTTSVNGLCRPCEGACATCRRDVARCLSCKQDEDNPAKYLFGRACFRECPRGTVLDEPRKLCVGCISGCERCELEDTNSCLKCSYPLLLLNASCYAQCPEGYRPNFWRTRCVVDSELRVVYMPQMLLTGLLLVVCMAGKYSSKNVFGQHRIFLSFYALTGLVDALTMWTQLLFTLL